jgi:hypothetical protein
MTNKYTATDLQFAKHAGIVLDSPFPSELERLRAELHAARYAAEMYRNGMESLTKSLELADVENKRLREDLAHARFDVKALAVSWTALFVLFIVWR